MENAAEQQSIPIRQSMQNMRRDEILRIKYTRRFKKIFSSILRNTDHEELKLTMVQFMMVSNLYQMNANYVFQFLEMAVLNNPIAVCVMYVILMIMLGVPLTMLITFMSSYSKKSFIQFWQCVPLFEGIGYSAGIIRLCIEVFNILHAAYAVLLLVYIQDPDFASYAISCKFAAGTTLESACITPYMNITRKCNVTQPYTAFQVYYRVLTKYAFYGQSKVSSGSISTLYAVAFVWTLVFFFSCLGLKRLETFAIYPQALFLTVITSLSFMVICLAEKGPIDDMRRYDNPLIRYDFWVTLILHTAEMNYLGNTIWIGTMKPDSLHPKFAALLNPPIKMLIFMALLAMMSIVTRDNAIHYKLENMDCLTISADDLLFVLVPDVLLRLKSWKMLLLLWYGSLFYFLVLPPTYSIIGFLISLEVKFPKLIKFRILVCLIMCTTGLISTLPLLSEAGLIIIVVWKYCGLAVLISTLMLLVNLTIFFIYTTDQVINDYTFTFGHPPEKYWTCLWKCCPIFSLFAFLFAITFQSANVTMTDYKMVLVASYIHSALLLLPVLIVAVIKFCMHIQNGRMNELIQPSSEWGPKDENLRLARKIYYPRRNIRFRIRKLRCKHKCSVMQDKAYQMQKDIQEARVRKILKDAPKT